MSDDLRPSWKDRQQGHHPDFEERGTVPLPLDTLDDLVAAMRDMRGEASTLRRTNRAQSETIALLQQSLGEQSGLVRGLVNRLDANREAMDAMVSFLNAKRFTVRLANGFRAAATWWAPIAAAVAATLGIWAWFRK